MFRRWFSFVTLAVALLIASSAVAVDGYKTYYKVRRGDTLSRIAKKKDVTVRQLKKWNRIRRNRIRIGQKLVIYSLTPQRPTRIVEHRIKRGDNLRKIAKKYNTTVKKIRKLNRLRRRSRIIAGRTLKIELAGPENPSVSHGRPQYGRLVNGEQLPKGPGYIRKAPKRAWGTNQTITLLMTIIPKVKKKWRRAPDVVIGDLSRKNGGHFPPHRSHQNGLDADIGYYLHKKRPKDFISATPKTLDVVKTWYLLKAFLDTGAVDYIFVDYSLQKPLYDEARKRGASKRFLKEHFQYPRSRGVTKGTIRHSPSHKNHFHIRFKPIPERTSGGAKARPRSRG